MGNANGKVYNDTDQEVTIYSFNYADGLRHVPYKTYEIAPGTEENVEASPHGSGLIVATGVQNNGRHYALDNGHTVNVSTILSQGDNNPFHAATTVFLAAGLAGAIAATGGAITAVVTPVGAATLSATAAAGIAGGGTFVTTATATGIAKGEEQSRKVLRSQHFYIINPQSRKALDVSGGGTKNGTNIHLWEFNGTGAQKWKLMNDGSIVNPNSGKALDVAFSGAADGTNIHLWERNGTGAQKWTVMNDGTIMNPQSGKVLDVNGGGTSNGTNVHLWSRNGTGAQKWVFALVD